MLAAAYLLLVPQAGVVLARRIDISLVGAPGAGHGARMTGGSSTRGDFAPRQPLAPVASTGGAAREASISTLPQEAIPFPDSRRAPASESLPEPAAGDVLADAASISPEASGSPTGTLVGWEGVQRKLIRKRNPEFPTVLSALGQEIEGEARISVAPSGIVTRVEITRSSGYIEIDASIEAALRDYLFSRVDGRIETVGTVHFRFRLEKQD
jgi:outer membrane biosynthesis protein TonB